VRTISPKTFPFVIDTPGKYALKADVALPNSNTTAILITTDNVELDLAKHKITSTNLCSGQPPVCPSPGTGIGIDATGKDEITVKNGEVRGMGADGIKCGTDCDIEKVRSIRNGGDGVSAGNGLTVEKGDANFNGGAGIRAGADASTKDSQASFNGTNGIEAEDNLEVTGGLMNNNQGSGIVAGDDAQVIGAKVLGNDTDGITAGQALAVERVHARGNTNAGIKGGTRSNVRNSLAHANGKGVDLDSGSGYNGNVLNANTTDVSGSAVNAGNNVCSGALCP
jgi:hypothetical protein